MAPVIESCRNRKLKAKTYRLQSFADPGGWINLGGPFRDNIRIFLSECGEIEDYSVEGMPVWITHLVDEKTGVVFPFYTVEEVVHLSTRPFCDYCRSTGWSHHFVSKRRYHLIIPMDSEWDQPLHENLFDLQNHLLHGLIHCNGYGHLLCINGHEGGSEFIRGWDIMDLFDRICTTLRTREITIADTSKKQGMEFRLLHGVAFGYPWFGRWGYRFCHGSFGITEEYYKTALHILCSFRLDNFLLDLQKIGADTQMKCIITRYQNLGEIKLSTLRDLLSTMMDLKSGLPFQTKKQGIPPLALAKLKIETAMAAARKKAMRERDFSEVAADLESRWSIRRLERAAEVIVEALKSKGTQMSRQDVRDAARLEIGDTGLLDFVLKSLGNCIVGEFVVRRSINASTRVLEFELEEIEEKDVSKEKEEGALIRKAVAVTVIPPTTRAQVYSDMVVVYKNLLDNYPRTSNQVAPLAAQVIVDTKHFVKSWPFIDNDDVMLRFFCRLMLPSVEAEELTRGIPPDELVVLPLHATVGELRVAGERALRDTYCILDRFVVRSVEGFEEGGEMELLFGLAESGAHVWLKGVGMEKESQLRYEGGADNWTVDCTCGARDDDGERMVSCDICEVWHHTRCSGIDDTEAAPQLFICSRCGTMLMPASSHHMQMEEEYA